MRRASDFKIPLGDTPSDHSGPYLNIVSSGLQVFRNPNNRKHHVMACSSNDMAGYIIFGIVYLRLRFIITIKYNNTFY